MSKPNFRPTSVKLDHTGEQHGQLEVLQYAGHRQHQTQWICECNCGDVIVAQYNNLSSGHTKSCGCTARPRGKQNQFWEGCGEISSSLFSKIRRDAARRSIWFDVELSYLWKLFLSQGRKCALTGWSIGFADVSGSKHDVERTASLDRIDGSLGYTRGNLRWVHKRINMFRGDLGDKDFLELVAAVAQHKGAK